MTTTCCVLFGQLNLSFRTVLVNAVAAGAD